MTDLPQSLNAARAVESLDDELLKEVRATVVTLEKARGRKEAGAEAMSRAPIDDHDSREDDELAPAKAIMAGCVLGILFWGPVFLAWWFA